MIQPSPQPPKKPLEERLIDLAIKALAGVSGVSSLVFLINNEISKAAIAGLLTGGFTILSSFREGFMKHFQDWANQRGEGLAKNLTDNVDSALDTERRRFKDEYYQSLIYLCRDYQTQGLKTKGPFTLDLEKVFVPLKVANKEANRISSTMIGKNPVASGDRIWTFLAAMRDREPVFPSMAILGAPGSGKTTLLEHLTLVYAQRKQKQKNKNAPALIPIPIYLRDVWEEIATGEPNLATLIEQQDFIKKLNPPPQWFEDCLRCGGCLVLFDGLDEVADKKQRQNVSRWVSQQIRDYPEVRFILTSRPFGFKDCPIEKVNVLEVQPFDLRQMQEFIHNWYLQREIMSRKGKDDRGVREKAQKQAEDLIQRIRNTPSLAAMALNPLLLTMIATVHCYRGALPGRRVELYGEICDVLLGRRREAKGIAGQLTAEQRKAVIQVLALALMQGNTREFTLEKGSNLIKNELLQVAGDRITPEAFLESIETESGLLVERESGIYEFAHKSFQEYLAAAQIKESNQEQILTARMGEGWWEETIRLYAAQSDATALILAVLGDDNANIKALKLALDCKEECLRVRPEVRKQLEDKLEKGLESREPEIASLAARVKLSQELSKLLRIDEDREISQQYISRVEYWLYAEDYERGEGYEVAQPATGISWQDAIGFCGWLSFVARVNIEEGTEMYYRLPTAAEAKSYPVNSQRDGWYIGANADRDRGIQVVKTPVRSLLSFDTVTVDAKGQTIGQKRGYSQPVTEQLSKDVILETIPIPGGKFLMGTEDEEIERLVKKFGWEGYRWEKPQHEVTVPPFFMGKTPVTQAQWRAIASLDKINLDLNPNPSHFKGDLRPVEQINWYEAVEFCDRLSRLTGREYRLPSEAEWEYACRAGTMTPFSFGDTMTEELANYRARETYANEPKGQYRGETTPVESFPPNASGLYDMHGNVWEWCADDWHDNYINAPTDGSTWRKNENDNRSQKKKDSDCIVLRSGSWNNFPYYCRSAIRDCNGRDDYYTDIGFRVACVVERT